MTDSWQPDDIVREFNAGNQNAFVAIFERYHAPLRYFAERIIIDQEEAKDIVAESFIKLWEKRSLFHSLPNIWGFLSITTKNACINFLRDSERLDRRHAEAAHLHKKDEHVLTQIIRAEVLRQVFEAIEALPPQCRKIAQLSFIEGKKNHEIADEMHLSVQTVKNQKIRAITLLKVRLSDADGLMLAWLYTDFIINQ
jgi:RNA polymerase sigma-70 factor (family 1)